MREPRVLSRAERLAYVEERYEAMLESRALARRGRTRQHLEPRVDLHRICRYRDRLLAALAQPFGERKRDARLADARRTEQRVDQRLSHERSMSGAHRRSCVRATSRAVQISGATVAPTGPSGGP